MSEAAIRTNHACTGGPCYPGATPSHRMSARAPAIRCGATKVSPHNLRISPALRFQRLVLGSGVLGPLVAAEPPISVRRVYRCGNSRRSLATSIGSLPECDATCASSPSGHHDSPGHWRGAHRNASTEAP